MWCESASFNLRIHIFLEIICHGLVWGHREFQEFETCSVVESRCRSVYWQSLNHPGIRVQYHQGFPGYSGLAKKWPVMLRIRVDKDENWEAHCVDWSFSCCLEKLSQLRGYNRVSNYRYGLWSSNHPKSDFHKVNIGNITANILFVFSKMLMYAQCFKNEQIGSWHPVNPYII